MADLQQIHDSTYYEFVSRDETSVERMNVWLADTAKQYSITYDGRFLTKMSK
jgi:hypothetical protein